MVIYIHVNPWIYSCTTVFLVVLIYMYNVFCVSDA